MVVSHRHPLSRKVLIMSTTICNSARTPCKAWNKKVYPPCEVFGEITNCGITADAAGRPTFWLDFEPAGLEVKRWMFDPANRQALTMVQNKHRIVFDGSVRINGRKQPRDPEKVREMIQAICNCDGYHASGSESIVGGELVFRCRQVKENGGWKERWSVRDV
jgi:hypothetical protein